MPKPAVLTRTLAAAAASLAAATALTAPGGPAYAAATETHIGPVLHSVAILGASHGNEQTYAVSRGAPAVLSVIDDHTGTLVDSQPLPGAAGSWGSTITDDGTVYIGADSKLFRYHPDTHTLDDLGNPVPGETALWRLTTDGTRVFVGTYPGGKVYSYDPTTDTVHDYGQLAAGEQYTRSVAFSKGRVYAGLGTTAKLVELNPDNGERHEIPLPTAYQNQTFVYDLNAAHGQLIMRLTPSNEVLAYDTDAQTWTDLGKGNGVDVSTADPKGNVYFAALTGELKQYNLTTHAVTNTGVTGRGTARGYGWTHLDTTDYPGSTLVTIDYSGNLHYYNPTTGAHKDVPAGVLGQPIQVQTLANGPDGKIYASGYLAGGLAAYDPATGTHVEYPGAFGQAEGMLAAGGKLYAGTYPGAHLYSYDPSQPEANGKNPHQFAALTNDGQDRPFAWAALPDGRLAIGTVPEYGELGGALTLADPTTGAVQVHRDIVEDQSVTALTVAGGLILGGTSVSGGLGIAPTQTEAKLFLADPTTGEKVWEGPAIPGEWAVSALTTAPDGHVWGATVNTLFEFDPTTRAILRTVKIGSFDWAGADHVWAGARLAFAPDGKLCGRFASIIACVDTTTLAVDQLATGAGNAWTMDDNGVIYFNRGAELYSLNR